MTIVDIKILNSQFILKKPDLGKKILRKQGKKPRATAAREEKKGKNRQHMLMTLEGGTGWSNKKLQLLSTSLE